MFPPQTRSCSRIREYVTWYTRVVRFERGRGGVCYVEWGGGITGIYYAVFSISQFPRRQLPYLRQMKRNVINITSTDISFTLGTMIIAACVLKFGKSFFLTNSHRNRLCVWRLTMTSFLFFSLK